MFKTLKFKFSPYAVLITGLAVVTLLTAWAGIWEYHYQLSHSTTIGGKKAVQAEHQASQAAAGQLVATPASQPQQSGSSLPKTIRAPKVSSPGPSQQTTSSPTASPVNTEPQTINLSLFINNQFTGNVTLSNDANQCDVLSQALAQGVLSSLDMRYSKDYGTYGVYVINGQGDPNTIWWTYKVNGVAPPYGCAYITAHQGDQVSWQYVKK